ncbi:MAG: hypothetical protein COA79_26400 [Planctomycetota bacterium]|nr:MAG: hypothetical protein COA79_26400 [Planctomycetota bacterium]
MITYRLDDALPKETLNRFFSKNESNLKIRSAIETHLDNNHGSCILKIPIIANMVIGNWQHFDNQTYDLVAYVVMPNHVHILIKVYKNISLKSIVHSWKSYTSNQFKICLNQTDVQIPIIPHWQKDYWDRYIRDEDHLVSAINYIHSNPTKVGLCTKDEDWPYSSKFTN